MEMKTALKKDPHVLSLLALGSMADTKRLDEYSDIDFFLIVKKGHKEAYITDLSWLEVHPVVFSFQNTPDGYKVLYKDNVFAEFAVFEPDELDAIPFTEGEAVHVKPGFDKTLLKPKKTPMKEKLNQSFNVNEAMSNLYIGLQRDRRGEHASAFTFIQVNAAGLIMELFEGLYESEDVSIDPFDKDRRIEQRFKESEDVLSHLKQGYRKNRQSAQYALAFLDEHFELNKAMKEVVASLAKV